MSAQTCNVGCSTCRDHERPSGGTVCLCDAGYSLMQGTCSSCPAVMCKEEMSQRAEQCLMLSGSNKARALSTLIAFGRGRLRNRQFTEKRRPQVGEGRNRAQSTLIDCGRGRLHNGPFTENRRPQGKPKHKRVGCRRCLLCFPRERHRWPSAPCEPEPCTSTNCFQPQGKGTLLRREQKKKVDINLHAGPS